MTDPTLAIILAKAQFLANHAMTFHLLTAEHEAQADIGGMSLRGSRLCQSYLEIADQLRGMIVDYKYDNAIEGSVNTETERLTA